MSSEDLSTYSDSELVASELALEQLIPALVDEDANSSVESGTESKPLGTIVSLATSCAINMFLPFINGMCLGFGEIFAHELGFRWGWSGSRIYKPERYVRVISN